MTRAKRGAAASMVFSLALAAAPYAVAEAPPPLASWETYTDLRSYYQQEPEPLRRQGEEVAEVRLRAGLRYNRILWDDWLFDADARAVARYRRRDPGDTERDVYLELKRLYLRGEGVLGSPFLWSGIGRKRVSEPSSQLYDDDLDHAQLGYDSTLLDVRGGGAGWLTDARIGEGDTRRSADEPQEAIGSRYLFGEAAYQWYRRHYIGADVVHEDFESPEDVDTGDRLTDPDDLTEATRLTWLRLRARGARDLGRHSLDYSASLATVTGSQRLRLLDRRGEAMQARRQDLSGGVGWDLRLIGRFEKNRYAAGIGYAGGTGGSDGDGDIADYRQPQIASNKAAVLGVEQYRYYGEAMAPRLANLHVVTAWGGLALTNSVWAEVAAHAYRQDEPRPWLFADRGVYQPNGESRDIGHGIDVILGGRPRDDLDVMVAAGGFFGGDAFDGVTRDPNGYRLTLDVNLRW